MSYLAAAACIISTAHQASPKVMGHMEDLRAQFARRSNCVITYSALCIEGELATLSLLSSPILAAAREDMEVRWSSERRCGATS